MTPAWGTAPTPAPGLEPGAVRYTVVGFHAANGQRFAEIVTAMSARAAEDDVYARFTAEGSVPQVCGVLIAKGGEAVTVDTYAFYLDPDLPEPT